jgi:hypothetical protein
MKSNQGLSRRRDDVKASGRAPAGPGRGRDAPRRAATLEVLALEDRRLMTLMITVTSADDYSGPRKLDHRLSYSDGPA